MSKNVIKQRQLPDNKKLTPKTEFVYTNKFNSSDIREGEVQLLNMAGSIKLNDYGNTVEHNNRGAGMTMISIGKGQVLYIGETYSGADTNIYIINKKDGALIHKETFDWWPYTQDPIKKWELVKFIGKPFVSQGDSDRYLVSRFRETKTTDISSMRLFNLDKLEWKSGYEVDKVIAGADGHLYPQYDGIGNVYFKGEGGAITKWDLFNNSTSILADGRQLYRAYVVSDKYLVLNTQNNFARIDVNTGEEVQLDGRGVRQFISFYHDNNIKGIASFNDEIYLMNIDKNIKIPIKQKIAEAGGIITDDEEKVIVNLWTNLVEQGDNLSIDVVIARIEYKLDGYHYLRTATITFNKDTMEFVSASKIGANFGIESQWADGEGLNNFHNSTNTYGIGKFYNCGLQKQWDNRKKKENENV